MSSAQANEPAWSTAQIRTLTSSPGGRSIDWACFPRFDPGAVFARALDPEGGAFRIAPAVDARVDRAYLDDTNDVALHAEEARAGELPPSEKAYDFAEIAFERLAR